MNKNKYFSLIMNVAKQKRLSQKAGLAHKWNNVGDLNKITKGSNISVNNTSKYRQMEAVNSYTMSSHLYPRYTQQK